MYSILAAFWDPGNDAFDVGDLGLIVGIVGGVMGALVIAVRWLDSRIDTKTKQIQPDTNGGRSLTDLHKKVDQFADYQRAVNDAREQSIELIIARQSAMADQIYRQADQHERHIREHQEGR